jgi:hypothetical protein
LISSHFHPLLFFSASNYFSKIRLKLFFHLQILKMAKFQDESPKILHMPFLPPPSLYMYILPNFTALIKCSLLCSVQKRKSSLRRKVSIPLFRVVHLVHKVFILRR